MTDFDDYVIKELWSEKELQWLCCGFDPNAPFGDWTSDAGKAIVLEKTDKINKAADAIRRAILAGTLPCIAPTDTTVGDKLYGHSRFFSPAEAAKWAIHKFPDFPKELYGIANESTTQQTSYISETESNQQYNLRTIGALALLLIEKQILKNSEHAENQIKVPFIRQYSNYYMTWG